MKIRMVIISGVLACLVLAACGGGLTTKTVNGRTVTAADQSVCLAVKQAYTDYQAKNYTQWRTDMTGISQMTPDNPDMKILVQEAKNQLKQSPAPTSKSTSTTGLSFNLGPLGAFQSLRQLCKTLGS